MEEALFKAMVERIFMAQIFLCPAKIQLFWSLWTTVLAFLASLVLGDIYMPKYWIDLNSISSILDFFLPLAS